MHACTCTKHPWCTLHFSICVKFQGHKIGRFLRSHLHVGYKKDAVCARRFFLYFLIMALINQVAITLFRTIGAIGRAAVLCNVASFIYIAFTLMLCGFIIVQGF